MAYNVSNIKEVFAKQNLGESERRTFYAVLGDRFAWQLLILIIKKIPPAIFS